MSACFKSRPTACSDAARSAKLALILMRHGPPAGGLCLAVSLCTAARNTVTRNECGAAEGLSWLGLEHFGVGEEAEAIRCWQTALRIAPRHPQALEYLETCGGEASPRAGKGRWHLLELLLSERRYLDALELLELALEETPNDEPLRRAHALVEARVVGRLARRLRFSQPPRVSEEALAALPNLPHEQRALTELARQGKTYADMLQLATRSRVRTCRSLIELEEWGVLVPTPVVKGGSVPAERVKLSDIQRVDGYQGALLFDLKTGTVLRCEGPHSCLDAEEVLARFHDLHSAARLVAPGEPLQDAVCQLGDGALLLKPLEAQQLLLAVLIDTSRALVPLVRLQVQSLIEQQRPSK